MLLPSSGDGRSNDVRIIVSEEFSKSVVRVARWEGWIVLAWVVIEANGVCYFGMWATNGKD